MRWKKIIKQGITLLELINEQIEEEGYTIFIQPYSAMVRADKYEDKVNDDLVFRLADLHMRSNHNETELLRSRVEDNGEQKVLINRVKASIRGLDLFLSTLDKNGDLDKIRGKPYIQRMDLVGESGLTVSYSLSRQASCNSSMSFDGRVASMCLSMDFKADKPVVPDYWVTLYSVFNMVKDERNEEIMYQLTESNSMPDVIQTAYKAVVYQEYDATCGFCSNYLEQDELYYEQCRECGYHIDIASADEEGIRAEEGDSAKVSYPVTGWNCPYDDEFSAPEEACGNHGISTNQEGPNYGYTVNDGYYMSRINCYLLSDNNFISDPDSERYIEYNANELISSFDFQHIISDMVEIFGDDEEALGALGIQTRVLGDGVVFEYDGETYYYDARELRLHDERFNEMQNHILSSGIDFEINNDIPFEDALDEVIENVEEMIESTENDMVESRDSAALKDLKNLLLELQSMR